MRQPFSAWYTNWFDSAKNYKGTIRYSIRSDKTKRLFFAVVASTPLSSEAFQFELPSSSVEVPAKPGDTVLSPGPWKSVGSESVSRMNFSLPFSGSVKFKSKIVSKALVFYFHWCFRAFWRYKDTRTIVELMPWKNWPWQTVQHRQMWLKYVDMVCISVVSKFVRPVLDSAFACFSTVTTCGVCLCSFCNRHAANYPSMRSKFCLYRRKWELWSCKIMLG